MLVSIVLVLVVLLAVTAAAGDALFDQTLSYEASTWDKQRLAAARQHHPVINVLDDPFQRNPGIQPWQAMWGLASMEVNDPIVDMSKLSAHSPTVSDITASPMKVNAAETITLSASVVDTSGAGINNVYFYIEPDYTICSTSTSPFVGSLTAGNQYSGTWTFVCPISTSAINSSYSLSVQAGDVNDNYGSAGSVSSFQVVTTNIVNNKTSPVVEVVSFTSDVELHIGDTLTMTASVNEATTGPGISYVLFSFYPATTVCAAGVLLGSLVTGGNYYAGVFTASCVIVKTAATTRDHAVVATAVDHWGQTHTLKSSATFAIKPATEVSSTITAQGTSLCLIAAALPALTTVGGYAAWKAQPHCKWVVGNYTAGSLPQWCYWAGVGCDANSLVVSSLALSATTAGTLATALGSLTTLTSLVVSGAGVTGSLPATIGSLTLLKSLVLGSATVLKTTLGGTLPPTLSLLTSLTSLEIRATGITPTLPPAPSRLTRLSSLVITGNTIPTVGSALPPTLSALTHLTTLVLNGLKLTSTVPDALSALTLLQQLDLSINALVAFPSGAAAKALSGATDMLTYLNVR